MAEAEGIPPTASVASVGLGINYIGQHCYGFSGEIGCSTSSITAFDFVSGSGYILFKATFTGPLLYGDPNVGSEANWQISLNDIVIANAHTDTAEGDIIQQPQLTFLVPPFTKVKIEVDCKDIAAAYVSCAVLTGRVYGV